MKMYVLQKRWGCWGCSNPLLTMFSFPECIRFLRVKTQFVWVILAGVIHMFGCRDYWNSKMMWIPERMNQAVISWNGSRCCVSFWLVEPYTWSKKSHWGWFCGNLFFKDIPRKTSPRVTSVHGKIILKLPDSQTESLHHTQQIDSPPRWFPTISDPGVGLRSVPLGVVLSF